MKLRPYQVEAEKAVLRDFKDHESLLVVMPTGTGKTVLLSNIVKRARKGRVLVIAHREELIKQLAATISLQGLHVGIEMADLESTKSGWMTPDVVVGTIQTLVARDCARLKTVVDDPSKWSLTVVDEAHHAPANSYRKLLEHMNQNSSHRILGMTATPDRADKLAMGSVFNHVSYEYRIDQAVKDGWLVPIRQKSVIVEDLDYSGIKTTAGDLNGRQLADVLEQERNLHAIAHPTYELTKGRQSVIFCASVDQAERMTEILNRYEPESARFVSGKTPGDHRALIFREFKEKRFPFLVNCMVATEGWDAPNVECVVLARPTKSRALYTQMVGRGLRPLPGTVDVSGSSAQERRGFIDMSDKTHCDVIDFVGNSGRHKLICTIDILAGESPKEVRDRAEKLIHEGEQDPSRALEKAQEEIEEEQRDKEAKKRRAMERRKSIRAKAKYKLTTIDPFDVLDIAPRRVSISPVTEKQTDFLMKFGIDTRGMSRENANTLQREIFRRMKKGLCTIKQANVLKKHGYSTECTIQEASTIISKLFSNKPNPRRGTYSQ